MENCAGGPAASGRVRAPDGLSIGDEMGISGRNLIIANSAAPRRIILKSNGAVGNAHMAFMSWFDGTGAEKVWCGLGSSTNTVFSFLTHYEGGLSFITYGGNHPIEFRQGSGGNQVRLRIHTNGYVGINEPAPTTPLHVRGAIRVGSATVAALPSVASSGAGAIIYVSNESGGATLAFSDGAVWRRAHDRNVVS